MKLDTNKALKSVKYNNVDVPLASGGLNVFVQETQPTAQNGLWIKRAKGDVSKVLIKPGFYLPDGETTVLGQELDTNICEQACAAVDGKIYNVAGRTRPGSSTSYEATTVQIFDTETETVTSKKLNHEISTSGYKVSSRNSIVIGKVIYYWMNNSTSSMAQFMYDTETHTETHKNIYPYKYTGVVKAGNFLYICAYKTNSSLVLKLDIETQTTTIVWQEDSTKLFDSDSGFSTLVGQVLWFISGSIIIAKFDLSTNIMTRVTPREYINNRNSTNAPTGLCRFLDTIYSIGGGSTSEVNKNIYAYNLLTGEVNVIENALNYTTNNSYWGGAAVVNGTAYVFGGGYITSSSYAYGIKNIAKFRINTSNFENKTVVVSPSLASNITEMYSDELTNLDFGVDEVYYQSAAGFNKQSAAIIKNGVVTDIGGGG